MSPFTARDRLRQTIRMVSCAVWTVASYVLWLPGALVTWISPHRSQRWNSLATRWWTGGLLRALSFRVDVRGVPPTKPFFLVSNHLSYVDILVLGSRLGCTFVSKQELGGWPLLGHLARVTGTIFINREIKRDAVRVLEEIDKAIANGAGIVVFPEGTSSRGDSVYPLKPALLQWAAERAFPVHVATLTYATDDPVRPADLAICWWGDMTFMPHLFQLLAVRRPRAILDFDPEPVIEATRTHLATKLLEKLQARLIPVMNSDAQ